MKLSSKHPRLGETLASGDEDGDESAETEAVCVYTSLKVRETKPSVRAEKDGEVGSGQCEGASRPACSPGVGLSSKSLSGDALQSVFL